MPLLSCGRRFRVSRNQEAIQGNMSEYQYYEFAAIDRSLTDKEMAELRSRSTRARITPHGFVNHYEWGDLKGDPADWMRRYFDAFVYTANWGSARLALRIPLAAFGKGELRPFLTEFALTIDRFDTHWIIDWTLNESEDYDRFATDDGSGWMGRLLSLRDELLRGDLRSLYLGWLAGVTYGEVDDDATEPETPAGLGELSGAQQALAEFLDIDPDLLEAAALCSLPVVANPDGEIDAWLATLSATDMRAAIGQWLRGKEPQAEREMNARFFAWQRKAVPTATNARRTVNELRVSAEQVRLARLQREARERKRREEEARKKRESYLATLAADFKRAWKKVEAHAERGVASGYDDAARAIADLAEACKLHSSRKDFDVAMQDFMSRHGRRSALVRRLVTANLWKK
jgi:hypothetical protein